MTTYQTFISMDIIIEAESPEAAREKLAQFYDQLYNLSIDVPGVDYEWDRDYDLEPVGG